MYLFCFFSPGFATSSSYVPKSSSANFSDLAQVVCNVRQPFPSFRFDNNEKKNEEEEEVDDDSEEYSDDDSETAITDEEAADDAESGFLSQF